MFNKSGRKGDILKESEVYQGPIFDLVKQEIKTPDGLTVQRDLIKHGNAVNILAITKDHKVVLNQEYRVGINSEVIALPAGLIDEGEDPIEAARREFSEETGYHADDVQLMTKLTSSDGFTSERVFLSLITFDQSNRGEKHFDTDEFVSNDLVPYDEVLQMVKDGEIFSAHTVASILYFDKFYKDF